MSSVYSHHYKFLTVINAISLCLYMDDFQLMCVSAIFSKITLQSFVVMDVCWNLKKLVEYR